LLLDWPIAMIETNPVIQAILNRRSVSPRRLVAPGPDEGEIEQVVQAAVAAPDHGRLRPWRFVRIGADGRDRLATAFADAARELDPGMAEEAIAREAEKAHNAPCLLAIITRIDDENAIAPPTEQWASVGAALQNMLLAAEALGYRAMMVSGRKVHAQSLRKAFGLAGDEHLVGFVSIGTAQAEPPPIERPQARDRLTEWE
jgi:nitroreductase